MSFIAGAAIGLGPQSHYGVDWIFSCGALNMAIGLLLLILVTRNERVDKAFYGEGEQGGLQFALRLLHPHMPPGHRLDIEMRLHQIARGHIARQPTAEEDDRDE